MELSSSYHGDIFCKKMFTAFSRRKHATGGVLIKKFALKNLQNPQENFFDTVPFLIKLQA